MKDNILHKISETLALLTHELREIRSDECGPFRSGHELATKHDLNKLKEIIMATQAEVTADLKLVLAQQVKTAAEIVAVQNAQTVAIAKIAELEALIAGGAGGTVTQELIDAVAAVKAQADLVDSLIPDVVTPPPTP